MIHSTGQNMDFQVREFEKVIDEFSNYTLQTNL